jgi:hypothetical protein
LSQSSCIAGMHCRDALLSGDQTHANHCDRHPSEVPKGGRLVRDSDRQQHRQCRSDRTDDRRTRRPDPHDARARTPCLIREWTPRPRGLSKAKCFDGDSSSCWRLRGALPKTLDYVSEARQFLRELSRSKHDSNVLAESIFIRFEPFTKLSGRFPICSSVNFLVRAVTSPAAILGISNRLDQPTHVHQSASLLRSDRPRRVRADANSLRPMQPPARRTSSSSQRSARPMRLSGTEKGSFDARCRNPMVLTG